MTNYIHTFVTAVALIGCARRSEPRPVPRPIVRVDNAVAGPHEPDAATGGTRTDAATRAFATPACALTVPRGVVIATRTGDVSVAARGDEALVTYSRMTFASGEDDPDPVTRREMRTALLGPDFAVHPVRFRDVRLGEQESFPNPNGGAVVFGGALASLAFSVSGTGTIATSSPHFALSSPVGSQPRIIECNVRGYVAAVSARGDVAAAATVGEWFDLRTVSTEEPALEVGVFTPARTGHFAYRPRRHRLPDGGRVQDSLPSNPAIAVGSNHIAVAWRITEPQAFHVQLIDSSAHAVGEARDIPIQNEAGTLAMTYWGERLFMIWAEHPTGAALYRLRLVGWDPEVSPPPPPITLDTPASTSAFAPAIAASADRLLVAWMEGAANTGVVKLGTTTGSLDAITRDALTVTPPGLNARDPEIALAGDLGWIVWQEFPDTRHEELRASSLRCR